MNLNTLDIENNMLLKDCQKIFSLYKCFRKQVSVWCQKKHLHCTISWHPRTAFLKHFESKCLYISVYLIKEYFCPKDVVIFYLVGWRMVGGGMISLGVLAVCASWTYILIFHFNWNFLEIQLFFIISILPSIVLKCWNFPDNLEFKDQIMAKFLIRSLISLNLKWYDNKITN